MFEFYIINKWHHFLFYKNNQTGKAFDITYIRVKFQSPRPESFALYKRTSEDGPWLPYQYYRFVPRWRSPQFKKKQSDFFLGYLIIIIIRLDFDCLKIVQLAEILTDFPTVTWCQGMTKKEPCARQSSLTFPHWLAVTWPSPRSKDDLPPTILMTVKCFRYFVFQ